MPLAQPVTPAPPTPFTAEPAPTTTALLQRAAQRWPDRVALDFLGATTTYAELADQVAAAARALAAHGVGAGDRVGVVLPNCPQHVVVFYAAHALGAAVAEHNPLAAPEEIRAQLDRHAAQVVVAWEQSVQAVAPGGDTQGRTVLAVDLTAGMPRRSRLLLRLPVKAARTQRARLRADVPDGVGSWERALRRAARPGGRRSAEQDQQATSSGRGPCPEDVAVLLPTGGTTGTPKLVPLTHANLMANAFQSVQWVGNLRPGEETFGSVLPFFHAFGMTLSLTAAVAMGASQVVLPTFDVDMVLAAQKRRPITFLGGVPPMFDRLEQGARDAGVPLRSIRYSVSGAMSLDGQIARRWEQTTGGLIIEGYGMSEGSPIILGNPLDERRRPGRLGVPFPGTSVRVVDPELLERAVEEGGDTTRLPDVPDGQVGELLAHGPQVFGGYLGAPEETAQTLLDGGWLRTGDLVTRDGEDGSIALADRRKELIIAGGFNIYPSQVEDAVRGMPGVVDVAVVGLPDGGAAGEQVVAALVLEPGASVELAQLRDWLQGKVSRYALPRAVHVLDDLPRSQLGKVLRRKVREAVLLARGQDAG